MSRLVRLAAYLLMLLAAVPPMAASEGPVLPRFASLSSGKVYLRQGPSYAHKILWVYHRKGLPVAVTAEFDVWRQIRLPDGAQGWVHAAMLSVRRTVVVTGESNAPLRAADQPRAKIVALAAPGVVAKLLRCGDDACEVEAGSASGWIEKSRVWGVSLGGDGARGSNAKP